MTSATSSDLPPPPSAPQRPAEDSTPYRATVALPLLASTVFVLGLGVSARLAYSGPLFGEGKSIHLGLADPPPAGWTFSVPLFLFSAGPWLITSAVLYAAGSIIDELRKGRAESSISARGR